MNQARKDTARPWASASAPRVLIVEDESDLSLLLGYNLEAEGYVVENVERGDEAELRLAENAPDLVILDWMLPGVSGLEICRRLRARESTRTLPVIMVTARGEEAERVRGLSVGADDYVVKPFGARELLARIRAVLRRTSPDARKIAQFGEVTIDFERRVVTRSGEPLKMTPAEYNLLTYFLSNPDRPLTRDMILNSVWGYESFPNTRTVDAHVVKLRQKLESDPNTPRHFLTVHGVGYRFLP